MTPLEEMQALMHEGIQLAGQMLHEDGEFAPYGFAMTFAGETEAVAPSESPVQPAPEQALDFLVQRLRRNAKAGLYTAVAVFAQVRVTPPGQPETQAIQVGLEHANGEPMNVYVPFRITLEGKVMLADSFAGVRVPVVF